MNGFSVLFKIKTLVFPQSFPLDLMHLVFLNITENMFKLWTGELGDPDAAWVLHRNTWAQIGKDMVKLRKCVPSDFGRPTRDIFKHHNGYKSEEWSKWATLYSVPILSDPRYGFPAQYLKPWACFVEAIQICSNQRDFSFADIRTITDAISSFIKHYERDYYQYKAENLNLCLSVFHNVLHFPRHILECGPPSCFWQYPMERFLGGLVPTVRSRRYPYQSLSNNLLLRTRRYLLEYIRKDEAWENTRQEQMREKMECFRNKLLSRGAKPPKVYAVLDENAHSNPPSSEFNIITHRDKPCIFHGPSYYETFRDSETRFKRLLSHYYTYYECETPAERHQIQEVKNSGILMCEVCLIILLSECSAQNNHILQTSHISRTLDWFGVAI